MKYIFELSKEHQTLPKDEVISLFEITVKKFDIVNFKNSFLEIECSESILHSVFDRLSFTYYVSEVLHIGLFNEVKNYANKIKQSRTFSVRAKKIDTTYKISSIDIEREIGRNIHGKVSLDNPMVEYRVIIIENLCYLCRVILKTDRQSFIKRKPQNRPFFSPISIHPKFARAMVNLSRLKNGFLLDPFCGTGGILIEAGIMGLTVIGSDINQKMIDGCKKNFEYFDIKNYILFQSDVSDINIMCDAIVTDPPYGRAASTKGEKLDILYTRAFETFKKILKKNKYLVIILPSDRYISIGREYFNFVEQYDIPVHKSLVRHICVYRND